MHELSLAHALLDIIEEYAGTHAFRRVNSLRLSVGRISCIKPESLVFAFEIQARGTRAEGAALKFDIIPVMVYCLSCEKEAELDTCELTCPRCGGEDVLLTGGNEELKLLELDVD